MKNILVTVADASRHDIDAVAQRLTAAGMQVGRVLPSTGVISGSVADHLRPGLGLVDGVAAVESDGGVQLPPPDSEIQ
jgi:hypothetical protein